MLPVCWSNLFRLSKHILCIHIVEKNESFFYIAINLSRFHWSHTHTWHHVIQTHPQRYLQMFNLTWQTWVGLFYRSSKRLIQRFPAPFRSCSILEDQLWTQFKSVTALTQLPCNWKMVSMSTENICHAATLAAAHPRHSQNHPLDRDWESWLFWQHHLWVVFCMTPDICTLSNARGKSFYILSLTLFTVTYRVHVNSFLSFFTHGWLSWLVIT